jgi:hypothetical protein
MVVIRKNEAVAGATVFASKLTSREFFKFKEAMEDAGFGMVSVPLRKGLAIYDRGLDKEGNPNGKSGYSVFVWTSKTNIRMRHQNPDCSVEAESLSPLQISRLHIETRLNPNTIDRIIKSIMEESKKKPENVFFIALHDHIKRIGDHNLVAEHIDDGKSDWKKMILHKKGENIDYDFGTSCHNNFRKELMAEIRDLEGAIGITKGASVELTMPFSSNSTNGPHHLLWFSDFETAGEYHERFLSKRIYLFPAYAPDINLDELRSENQQLRKEMKLAVGIAHPISGIKLPLLGTPPCGLLDLVARGFYPLDWATDYVAEYADAVGCFNPSEGNPEITFANPSEGRRMFGLVSKWKTGSGLTMNSINTAFALEMRERYGTVAFADNDVHRFHKFRFKHTLHGYGKLRTVLEMPEGQIKKPDTSDIIHMLRTIEERGRISAFVPYDRTRMDLYKARRNEALLQKLEDTAGDILFHIKHTVPDIYADLKMRIAGFFH